MDLFVSHRDLSHKVDSDWMRLVKRRVQLWISGVFQICADFRVNWIKFQSVLHINLSDDFRRLYGTEVIWWSKKIYLFNDCPVCFGPECDGMFCCSQFMLPNYSVKMFWESFKKIIATVNNEIKWFLRLESLD